MNFGKNLKNGKKKLKTVHNKKYMSIAVSVVRERQSSASALVVRGRTESRNTATAYISVRYHQL